MRIRIKQKKTNRFKKPGCWVAMSTLAVYAINPPAAARAQKPASSGQNPQTSEQTLPVMRFDITPAALDEVLREFERAAGWKVEIPDAGMRSLPSKGVSGVLPAPQALRQILSGTGLTFDISGDTAKLRIQGVRESIVVADRPAPASPRYSEPLRDIPQTITVIPASVIQQQGATSLTDVLRNVPGLTIAAGEGGTPAGDNLTIRGNSARNDIFVDGVRDLSPQSRDPFNVEQVEVTKGPTSAVSGRGSAGGTVNLISKGPSLNRILRWVSGLGKCGHAPRLARHQFVAAPARAWRAYGDAPEPAEARCRRGRPRRREERALGHRADAGVRSRHSYPLHAGLLQAQAGQHLRLRDSLDSGHQQCAGRLSRPAGAGSAQYVLRFPRSRPRGAESGYRHREDRTRLRRVNELAHNCASDSPDAIQWQLRRAWPATTPPQSIAKCGRGSPKTGSGTTRPTCGSISDLTAFGTAGDGGAPD